LGELLKDPVRLVSFQCVIRVELVLEDPFAGDDIRGSRLRNEILGVVGYQGIKFFFHCIAPNRIGEHTSN
jgi:hypothetical protein